MTAPRIDISQSLLSGFFWPDDRNSPDRAKKCGLLCAGPLGPGTISPVQQMGVQSAIPVARAG